MKKRKAGRPKHKGASFDERIVTMMRECLPGLTASRSTSRTVLSHGGIEFASIMHRKTKPLVVLLGYDPARSGLRLGMYASIEYTKGLGWLLTFGNLFLREGCALLVQHYGELVEAARRREAARG